MPALPVGVEVLAPKPVDHQLRIRRRSSSRDARPRSARRSKGSSRRSHREVGRHAWPAGNALLQIDPAKQQATVQSDEAAAPRRRRPSHYAQQQFERAKQLLKVGAISQQEYDQAESDAYGPPRPSRAR